MQPSSEGARKISHTCILWNSPPWAHFTGCPDTKDPLDDDHSPAFAEDHPVSFSIEGAGGLLSGSFVSGHPVKCAQGGEFHKMQVCEIFLAPSDDGCIDDAVSDHLDGAVKCDQ